MPRDDGPEGEDTPGSFGQFPSPEDLNQLLMAIMSGLSSTDTPDQTVALAAQIANGGSTESNVDPTLRMRAETLARVAQLHVQDVSRSELSGVELLAVNRTAWIESTVKDFKTYISALSDVMGKVARVEIEALSDDDFEIPEGMQLPPGVSIDALRAFKNVSPAIPQILNTMLSAGLVGQLAARSFGIFDMPLPRESTDRILIVAPNIAEFGKDWELPTDDLLLWICTQEFASYAALRSPGIRDELTSLVMRYLNSFETPDHLDISEAMGSQFGAGFDDPASSLDDAVSMFGDPLKLLRSLQSPGQRALRPQIDRLVGVTIGYIDWIVDQVTDRLLPQSSIIGEALRRRRVETDAASQFVEQLFGLELSISNLDSGRRFVHGVIERGGRDALDRLLSSRENLPTQTEYEAPGLWLTRLGFDIDDAAFADELAGFEVPDFIDDDI